MSIIDNSYLLPSSLGKSKDIGVWVGSTQEMATETNNLHEIKLNIQNNDVYAYIRLFANLGSSGPTYLIVVARATQGQAADDPMTFVC